MRLRSVLYLTVATGLLAASATAGAAPKPVCNILTDASGDSSPNALDITSADIATGKTQVVGVVRVKSMQTESEPTRLLGLKWTLAYQIAGTDYSFAMERTSNGLTSTDTASSMVAGETGPVPTLKVDATSITWTIPRSVVASLKKPKQLVGSIAAMSYLMRGSRDTAITSTKYPDLTPSCVKAS